LRRGATRCVRNGTPRLGTLWESARGPPQKNGRAEALRQVELEDHTARERAAGARGAVENAPVENQTTQREAPTGPVEAGENGVAAAVGVQAEDRAAARGASARGGPIEPARVQHNGPLGARSIRAGELVEEAEGPAWGDLEHIPEVRGAALEGRSV